MSNFLEMIVADGWKSFATMKILTLQLQMMAELEELDLAQVGVSFWWFFHQGKLSMYSNYKWLMWEINAYYSHKSAYFNPE